MVAPENRSIPQGQRLPQDRVPKGQRKRRRGGKKSPWYWRLLRVVALVYLGLSITMAWLENRLVYPGAYGESATWPVPDSIEPTDPASLQTAIAKPQTLRYGGGGDPAISSDDVLPGRVWLLPGEERSDRWIVFFHGNGIRAVDLDRLLTVLGQEFACNVMAAEYRGFTDDRDVSETGVIADGIAAVECLINRFDADPSRMIFWGRSLGGGVAAAAAVRHRPMALVMDRTFDSTVNVAKSKFWYLPVSLLMKNRFDSAARMRLYDGPLVVVHGTEDHLVPFAAGRRLFEAAISDAKFFVEVPDMGHLDPMSPQTLAEIKRQVLRLSGGNADADSDDAAEADDDNAGGVITTN